LSNFALTLKNRVALKIFNALNTLFTFRIFEQVALALKNRVCPEIFHCIEYTFEQVAIALKNRVALKSLY